jgi:hypothetical protein
MIDNRRTCCVQVSVRHRWAACRATQTSAFLVDDLERFEQHSIK